MRLLDVGLLNRKKRLLCFPKQVLKQRFNFSYIQRLLYNEIKQTLQDNVVLYIHSTKSLFIMFNFTVFDNIRMNIRMISSD